MLFRNTQMVCMQTGKRPKPKRMITLGVRTLVVSRLESKQYNFIGVQMWLLRYWQTGFLNSECMVLIIILGTVMFHVNLYLIFNSFVKSNEHTPPPYTHTQNEPQCLLTRWFILWSKTGKSNNTSDYFSVFSLRIFFSKIASILFSLSVVPNTLFSQIL